MEVLCTSKATHTSMCMVYYGSHQWLIRKGLVRVLYAYGEVLGRLMQSSGD